MSDNIHVASEDRTGVEHSTVWEPHILGRIIQGARHREGYERMADLVLDMDRRTGVRRHENTLYDICNGKRLPDLEVMGALMLTLKIRYSEIIPAAVCEEYRDAMARLL